MSDVTEWGFCQRSPPLWEYIQVILKKYPHGGQILKELIQNADDAGATEVQFLLDARPDAYGKETLINPGLARFQGPALYAQNDAVFKDSDWDSIQTLHRSVKKKDPMKVGRFGIGFNSVYHLTDLPSVVSDKKVAFFDPQENCFKKGGAGHTLSASAKYPDQFAPYNVFGWSMADLSYEGTLFRFPLRSNGDESDLSESIHSPESIRATLFEPFKKDAHLVPLFLKCVESIKLFDWRPESESPVEVFSVSINEESRQAVRDARARINVGVRNGNVLVEEHFEAVVTCRDEFQVLSNQKWLIAHHISNEHLDILKLSKKLHQSPWIGLALPIPPLSAQAQDLGRMFCFLPLPPSDDSNTGLPVHVHGSFSVADNRRSLNWRAADCMTDDEVAWNELLLDHLVAPAYEALISKAIALSLDHETVYRAWPELSRVKCHWHCFLDKFLCRLLCKDVFWTDCGNGSWISLEEAVVKNFSELNADELVAYEEMMRIGVPVVLPPENVLSCLDRADSCYQLFDPKFLRSLLREGFRGLTELSSERKLSLLAFALKDENYADLVGLFLLPVNDGSFVAFECSTSPTKIFIENNEISLSLFPGMNNRFLHCALSGELYSKLTSHECLKKLSLVKLEHRHVSSLLKRILTCYWPLQEKKSTLPWSHQASRQWMQDVWGWLREQNKHDEFVGYFVVPFDNFASVAKLVCKRNLIFAQHNSALPMSRNVASAFRSAGCVVLQDCPDYISLHYELLKYVWTQDKVMHCIAQVPLSVSSFQNWKGIQSQEVLSFLSGLIDKVPLTSAVKSALRSMPLFRLYNSPAYSSLRMCPASVPESVKNLSLMRSLLSFPNYEESTVLRNLSSFHRQLNFEELFTEVVFPDMETYGMDYTTSVVEYLLDNLDIHHPLPDVVRKSMSKLNFIRVADGTIKKPSELFLPSPLAWKLFRDKPVFPKGPFALSKMYSDLSRIVCFRTLESISGSEIVEIAREASAGDAKKGEALLSLLVCKDKSSWVRKRLFEPVFSAFGKRSSSTVAKMLKRIRWCPVEYSVSCYYPSILPWKSVCCRTAFPSEIVCALTSSGLSLEKLSFLVGSTELILKGGVVQDEILLKLLGLRQVTLDSVLEHWLKAMEKYKSEKESCGVQFGQLMTTLFSLLPEFLSEASLQDAISRHFSDPNFIWISDDVGFVSANRLAVSCCDIRSLKPWLFSIRQGGYSHLSSPKIQSALGIKSEFSQSVLLNVLAEIKIFHDKGKALAEEVARDLEVAVGILDWFAKNVNEVSATLLGNVLVPVKDPLNLRLLPCADVIYFDRESNDSDGTDCNFIHGSITRETALKLRIPFFSSRLALSEYKDAKRCLDDHTFEFGEEFGQQEPLARRLANIIRAYPWGVQILKELVQNADDAGASVLHIVYDKRNHPTKRVFGDGWKHLQGPALLVYNDRPFSEDDLLGIQNLGLGSKRDDAAKTGQFGIGFNAVYHLTDCPSFISDNKFLCVLDPLRMFIRSFSSEKPGRKINLTESFWEKFSDVKNAYYSVFSFDQLSGGTLFRFPLRHAEYTPPEPIRRTGVSSGEMDNLLKDFADISSDLLLFLNSLTTIKLSVIDDKERTEKFSVHAELDSSSIVKRQKMFQKIAAAKKVKTFQIPWFQVAYELKIFEDKKGCTFLNQRLLVLQSIGSRSLCDGKIRDFSEEAVLPRAGIAVSAFEHEIDYDGKAYCFLPLPDSIPLPVYVNGHFALDSSRRDLFRESSSERAFNPKQAWNEDLIDYCIAPAYAAFLEEAKRYVNEDLECTSDFGRVHRRLAWFHSLFPLVKVNDKSYWNRLSCKVYLCLLKSQSAILAYVDCLMPLEQSLLNCCASYSVNELYSRLNSQDKAAVDAGCVLHTQFPLKPTLIWYSLRPVKREGIHNRKALYWSHKDIEFRVGKTGAYVLRALLVLLGLPVVTTTQRIFSSLKSVGDCGVEMASTESICTCLYHYDSSSGPRKLTLCEIKATLFKSPEVVSFLLSYLFGCQKVGSLSLQKLKGLPLLVTGDERLNLFSEKHPIYISRFLELFPTSLNCFVHPHIRDSTFSQFSYSEITDATQTICLLSPSAFVARLSTTDLFPLNVLQKYTLEAMLPLPYNWITQFWNYITTEGLACCSFDEAISRFSVYPLIPATRGSQSVIVPVELGYTVLHVTDSHIPHPAQEAMTQIGMPLLRSKLVSMKAVDALVESRLVTFNSPQRVIKALRYLTTDSTCFCRERLKPSVSLCILKYFNSRISSRFPKSSLDELCAISLFESATGSFLSISNRERVCLPKGLLLRGSEIWMVSKETVFLKSQPELSSLYNCLEVTDKTLVEAYVEFILPKFKRLSDEDRMKHLLTLKSFPRTPKLLESLSQTSCFWMDGVLSCVNSFYDPDVELFSLMLDLKYFPPGSEEDEAEWLEFLRTFGLRKDASPDLLLELAQRLETEGKSASVLPFKWEEKSKCLFHHLINNNYEDCVRRSYSSLKCLPSAKIRKTLAAISKPFSAKITSFKLAVKYSEANERLCWTSRPLAPKWTTNPRQTKPSISIAPSPSLSQVVDNVQCYIVGYRKASTHGKVDEQVSDEMQKITLDTLQYLRDNLRLRAFPVLSASSNLRDFSIFKDCFRFKDTASVRDVKKIFNLNFIFIKEKNTMVNPLMVVRRSPKELLHLHPYFYELPDVYGMYTELLRCFGVDVEARPFHCARVLEDIYLQNGESNSALKDPNDLVKAKLAIEFLFRLLENNPKRDHDKSLANALSPLFLMNRRRGLEISSNLFFLDNIQYEEYIETLDHSFLIDLATCNLSFLHEKTVDLLPECLRPKNASTLYVSRIKRNSMVASTNGQHLTAAECLQTLITSQHFVLGIKSIFFHHSRNSKLPSYFEAGLTTISTELEIKCLRSFSTCLVQCADKVEIAKTSEDGDVYLDISEMGKKAVLYITESAFEDNHSAAGITFQIKITKCLTHLLRCSTDIDTASIVGMLTLSSPSEIPLYLKKFGIFFSTSGHERELQNESRRLEVFLGREVNEIHMKHIVQENYFEDGEWAIYRISENKAIHAQVITAAVKRSDEDFSYYINTGQDEIAEVDSSNLYKFMKRATKAPQDLAPAIESRPSRQVPNHQESTIFDAQLPALSDEGSEIAICELDMKSRRAQGSCRSIVSHSGFHGNSIATCSGSSLHFDSDDDYILSFPSSTCSPQPEIGRMFHRQAEADFLAAREQYEVQVKKENGNFAVVCFLCHECAEKVLKGVLLLKKGLDSWQKRSHDLRTFLPALSCIYFSESAKITIKECILELNSYYISTRYPDALRDVPALFYKRDSAHKALESAETIVKEINAGVSVKFTSV